MANDPVGLLQELIRIPSVNPDGASSAPPAGEKDCAAYIAEFLEALGAEVELHEVRDGRPNVLARFAGGSGKPRLLLAPHTDTVAVDSMTIDPFAGNIEGGRVYGRGASDTKGSIAAMLWALKECGTALSNLRHEIWFAALMGEEVGQLGARALAHDFKPDFVVVGEPTGCDIVYKHKGCLWIKVETTGKAGHASNPSAGHNAIYDACRCVSYFESDLQRDFQLLADDVLGFPSLSVGRIHGGNQINIIPERCALEVDLRTIPAQDQPEIISSIEKEINARVAEAKITSWSAPPLDTDPSHPVIALLNACGAKNVGAPWFCDAAVFAEEGIPAIALGPGSISQAHTSDEWIKIADLERGVAFYRRFLEKLGGK